MGIVVHKPPRRPLCFRSPCQSSRRSADLAHNVVGDARALGAAGVLGEGGSVGVGLEGAGWGVEQ